MPKYFFTLLLLVGLFLTACQNAEPVADINAKPEWVSNPAMNGKKGYVGIAPVDYFYGAAKQKEIAVHYALDGLSKQLGVEVSTLEKMQTSANSQDSSSTYQSTSQHHSNNKVLAHIEATWTDPQTKELYVWMVLDQ